MPHDLGRGQKIEWLGSTQRKEKDMRNNHMTPETAAKIEAFQDHFWNFDWSNRDDFAKDWVALMRESLDAGGLDFNSREKIEGFMNFLEPQWAELGRREKEIAEQIKDVFREAGATEVQLTWGIVENIRFTRKQERKLDRLASKMDEVRTKMLPIMGLAAALNEAKAQLA